MDKFKENVIFFNKILNLGMLVLEGNFLRERGFGVLRGGFSLFERGILLFIVVIFVLVLWGYCLFFIFVGLGWIRIFFLYFVIRKGMF